MATRSTALLARDAGGGQWEQYVHRRTLRDFYDRVMPQVEQAQRQQADEQEQRQQLESLSLKDMHWARGMYGVDPFRWPEHLRRRLLLGAPRYEGQDSGDDNGNIRLDAMDVEAGDSGSRENAPSALPLPLVQGCCSSCLLAERPDGCDLDIDVGIGCTECRDADMECVASNGSSLAKRPPQDVRIPFPIGFLRRHRSMRNLADKPNPQRDWAQSVLPVCTRGQTVLGYIIQKTSSGPVRSV